MKRITAIVLVLTVFAAAVAYAQEASTRVSEVVITGNEVVSRNTVLSYIKTRAGQTYNEDVVKDDCTRLRESGRFSSVRATAKRTPEGIIVSFILAERELIAAVEMKGNKEFTSDHLLAGSKVAQGQPLDRAAIESLRKSIINQYKEEGHHFVEVVVDPDLMKSEQKVTIMVVEGPHVVIKDMSFEGNHYYNDLELLLKTKTKEKFWPIIAGDFNEEKVDSDVATIRQMYLSEGFLDVEVTKRLDPSPDKRVMNVTFIIKEGGRYRINEIIFEGNTVFTGEELAGRLKLQQGRFFTTDAHRQDVETIEASYGELGYVDASVRAEKRFISPETPVPAWARGLDGGQPSLINLVYIVAERDRYLIGDVIIKGNNITEERVILREITLYPEYPEENVCNTQAIELSEARLKGLRIFDRVSVTPIDSRRQGVKDILVEVTEGNTAEIMLGVGVNSNSGLIGTVSLTQRNFDILNWPKSFGDLLKPTTFKGAGQRLSLVAQPGTELSRFTVSWFTPYIFDRPYSFGTKFYLFDRGFEHYNLTRLGAQVSVGRRFPNRWRGEIAARVENVEVDTSSSAAVEVAREDGNHNIVGLRGTLTRDRTNDPLLPSEGDRLVFSYEQVVGDYSFGRFNSSYNTYHTVYKDALNRPHIIATKVAFGQIFGNAPPFERFYGGGIGSLRGFDYRGISPRGHTATGIQVDDPIGGDMMVYAGAEYTFPIIGDNLRGMIFLDTGTVEESFGISGYRASIGAGLRWTIPALGPVPMTLNFGIPLLKEDEDDEEIFSFSLGASL